MLEQPPGPADRFLERRQGGGAEKPKMTPRNLVTAALLTVGLLAPQTAAAATITTDGLDAAQPVRSGPAVARAADTSGEPNLTDQWALASDQIMGILTAWRQVTGGETVVAIVDSGVDVSHRDLAPNIWTNAGEIPGNGADDDHNGYVDDVNGYDFVDRDGNPADANGHGTHVAGIVGARGDNGLGGSGVAQRVRMMAVRVLDANAAGTTDNVAKGIRYAVDNGAKIVNLSLAGPSAGTELENAVAYAHSRGVLIVAAAGNQGRDLGAAPAFPVSLADDFVIGVAAINSQLHLADISNYGAGADIAAPGADILSTAVGGGYEWRTGTSMAAPAVAGTLALIAAARPDLGAEGLRDSLYAGATAASLPVAYGQVNAAGALRKVIAPEAWKEAIPSKAPDIVTRSAADVRKARAAEDARVRAAAAKKAAAKRLAACKKAKSAAAKKGKKVSKRCRVILKAAAKKKK